MFWAQPPVSNTLQVPASEMWFETNAGALRWEMKASGRPLAQTCDLANWLPLLSDWEAANYNGYIAKFCTMYGVEREQELPDDCSCCVTQNPVCHAQHSRASDRALNTLLASGTPKIVNVSKKRWLTTTEKLCAMGFPGISAIADAMELPRFNAEQLANGHQAIGNAQHMGNVVMVLLAVFSSVALIKETSLQELKVGVNYQLVKVPCDGRCVSYSLMLELDYTPEGQRSWMKQPRTATNVCENAEVARQELADVREFVERLCERASDDLQTALRSGHILDHRHFRELAEILHIQMLMISPTTGVCLQQYGTAGELVFLLVSQSDGQPHVDLMLLDPAVQACTSPCFW